MKHYILFLLIPLIGYSQNIERVQNFKDLGQLVYTMNSGHSKIFKKSENQFVLFSQTESGAYYYEISKESLSEMQEKGTHIKEMELGSTLYLETLNMTVKRTKIGRGTYFVYDVQDSTGKTLSFIFNVSRLKNFSKTEF